MMGTAVSIAEQTLGNTPDAAALDAAASALADLDRQLQAVPGLWCMLSDPAATTRLQHRLETLQQQVAAHECTLDQMAAAPDDRTEQHNAALIRLKDALWAVHNDRLRHARSVRELAGGDLPHLAAATAFSSLDIALSALDRLEVRGRDSAGITLVVNGVDPADVRLAPRIAERATDRLFQNGSVRAADGCINFVYKRAAEI
ncbi:MAG: glucosamine-6-phosphate synthase, partial [Planctomycetes bacterium]|nr:glucosamine-6-phosphate synthase [Planctomycetota bacterium]